MNSTMLIIFLSGLTVSFAIAYLAIKHELQKTRLMLIDILELNILLKEKVVGITSEEQDVHKESFIKFLSDSRDWAYDYIETTQKTIKEVAEGLSQKGLPKEANKLLSLLPKEELY